MIALGKHVKWKKIKGDFYVYTEGFGTLGNLPTIGVRLHIVGDDGIMTSRVRSVDDQGDTFIVETEFSTYKVSI